MRHALLPLADAYTRMPSTPNARYVRDAYALLCRELWWQFARLPMRVTFSDTDPYANSHDMHTACDRGQLRVYRGVDMPADHPFARTAPNGERWNSVFRAVHDGMAHRVGRYGFGARGEVCAFRAHWHSLTLTPRAQWALATETLGQTAVYTCTKTYAEQKAGLLPFSLVAPFTAEDRA